MVMIWVKDGFSSLSTMSFRTKWVTLQNRNKMQKALIKALIVFTILATLLGSEVSCVKKLATSIKNGAPGGCPTSSLYPVVINSGQSQKLAVGSLVEQETNAAIKNIVQ